MTKAQVIALIDQYITTNGNEEITGAQTNSVMKALANQDIPFSEIVSKPTTLSGYGITDAYTKSVSDGRYVNITGNETMTGYLRFTDNTALQFGSDADSQFSYGSTNDDFRLDGGKIFKIRTSGFADAFSFDPSTGNMNASGNINQLGHITPQKGLVGQSINDANTFQSTLTQPISLLPVSNFSGSNYPTSTGGAIMYRGGSLNRSFALWKENGNNSNFHLGNYNESSSDWEWNRVYHSGNLTLATLGGVPNTRSILAGTGLTGGGNLTANRTLSINPAYTGFTNYYNKTESESRYVNITGNETMTGYLRFTDNTTLQFGSDNDSQFSYGSSNDDFRLDGGKIFKIRTSGFADAFSFDPSTGNMNASGNITAQAFFESSDRRLKKNIQPLNYGLREIEKIDTHTWNWKKDGSEDMGLIAQELELIMPELVKTNKEGYKSVNYTKLVPVLINAIKELSKEVELLKSKIDG